MNKKRLKNSLETCKGMALERLKRLIRMRMISRLDSGYRRLLKNSNNPLMKIT